MRFDRFGAGAIIFGLLILAGMMHFYFNWEWILAITALAIGIVLVIGIFALVVGLLLLIL